MFLLPCGYHVLNIGSHIILKSPLRHAGIKEINICHGLLIHQWGESQKLLQACWGCKGGGQAFLTQQVRGSAVRVAGFVTDLVGFNTKIVSVTSPSKLCFHAVRHRARQD